MPLPPLAASERRLARVSAASSWICAAAGVAIALAPRLALRGLMLGGHAPAAPGTRLFAALAGAGLLGLSASLRRAVASPREQRQAFAPLLWLVASSALFLFIAWRRGDSPGLPAAPLGAASLVCALFTLALAHVYFRAAPGVNLGAAIAPADEAPAKAVQLGVRLAKAPELVAAPPQAAAGASNG